MRGKYNVKRHAVEQPLDHSIKLIPLTQGMNAIVDAKNYERFMESHWFPQKVKRGLTIYVVRKELLPNGKFRKIYMHREVMGDGERYDHINNNGLDNREDNLRTCEQWQNGANRPKQRRKIGYKGVYHCKNGRFEAKLSVKRTRIYLGRFDTDIEGAKAYDRKAIELLGEFARTNFPRSEYD
jgi:hypothetical protein